MASDEAIQLTNNDATNFKAYAVSKGYWSDPYLTYFASKSACSQGGGGGGGGGQQPLPVEHKPPEMSRGYFARVNAIRSVVYKFLSERPPGECQVVNLGCGFDTLFFDLCDRNLVPSRFVEIDFTRMVMSKIRVIKSKKALSDKIWKNQSTPVAPVAPAAPAAPTAPAAPSGSGEIFKLPSLPTHSFPPGPSNEIKYLNLIILTKIIIKIF